MCFASDWVANQFYLKLRLVKLLRVASLILSTSGDVELSALRGYWFVTVSHMILSSGGSFECRWLDTGDKFKITLPESKSYTFKSDADASLACQDDLSVYCVPRARNQATIDSMSSPYLFFQMASGPRHRINKDGLFRIMKAMKKGGRFTPQAENFVRGVCVPARTRSTVPVHYTSPQSFVEGNLVASEIEAIQQAVLEVPIDFCEEDDLVHMVALDRSTLAVTG